MEGGRAFVTLHSLYETYHRAVCLCARALDIEADRMQPCGIAINKWRARETLHGFGANGAHAWMEANATTTSLPASESHSVVAWTYH